MSCTETHIGKFEILARGEDNIDNYLKNHPEIKTDGDWIDDENYEIIYKYLKPNYEHILIHFLEHQYFDEDDYLSNFKKNEDGTYSFAVQFYNGGCCLGEALGDFENEHIL